jgi:hypothetical protein
MKRQRFRAIYQYENGEIFYDPGDEADSPLKIPNQGDDFRIPGEKMLVVTRGTPRVVPDARGEVIVVPVICKPFVKSSVAP